MNRWVIQQTIYGDGFLERVSGPFYNWGPLSERTLYFETEAEAIGFAIAECGSPHRNGGPPVRMNQFVRVVEVTMCKTVSRRLSDHLWSSQ